MGQVEVELTVWFRSRIEVSFGVGARVRLQRLTKKVLVLAIVMVLVVNRVRACGTVAGRLGSRLQLPLRLTLGLG